LVTIDVIEGVFSPAQKQQLIAKVTAAMIEVDLEIPRDRFRVEARFTAGDGVTAIFGRSGVICSSS
jgi:hypothetical protein